MAWGGDFTMRHHAPVDRVGHLRVPLHNQVDKVIYGETPN